jgi:hypothetical protein
VDFKRVSASRCAGKEQIMKLRLGFTAAALTLFTMALQPGQAEAQSWSAFEGCWRATGEGGGQIVCVLPAQEALSARLVTVSGDRLEETLLRADGIARPVQEGGCAGTEKAFFSEDGRRVYTHTELECAARSRVSTGVMAMLSAGEWIDAQAITVAGQHAARSLRYRGVERSEIPTELLAQLPTEGQMAREVARMDAAAPLEMGAVVEASRVLAAPALEELLAARGHGYGLDARRLRTLKEQGVPASTIDLMVALSYPQRFAVRERAVDPLGMPGPSAYAGRSAMGVRQCYDPFWGWRTSMSGSCYGYGSSYDSYGYRRYSPYGYDGYGWSSGPTYVIVNPRDEGQGEGGTVTRGEGYTRGGEATRGASPRGATSNTPQPSARPNPSVNTSPGSSSDGASSSGSSGSGSSEPRTAKPRGD